MPSLHSQIDSHKIRSGYLYKKGQINRSWKKRYFVSYDDRTIDYFKEKSHATQRNKAKGTIHLTQINRVELVSYNDPNQNNNNENNNNTQNNDDKSFVFKETISNNNTPNVKKDESVNGWCTMNNTNNNNIISSIAPPADYNNIINETEKQFEKERQLMSKSLLDLKNKHNKYSMEDNYILINQSAVSPAASGAECELTDIEDDIIIMPQFPAIHIPSNIIPPPLHLHSSPNSTGTSTPSYVNKSIISGGVKDYHRKTSAATINSMSTSHYSNYSGYSNNSCFSNTCSSVDSSQIHNTYENFTDFSEFSLTPRDEIDAFQIILSDTKLHLQCDRRYAFALISSDRQWILSADTNQELKDWITLFSKLSQGKQLFDGFLNDKYFILYQNKVLNCYKNKGKEIEFDIDLRHALYLKSNENEIEIASNANIKNSKKENRNLILAAQNTEIASEWFHKINKLFNDKYLLKILYNSACDNIHIYHNGQDLKNRYIAQMSRDYIVIFKDKKQLKSIKAMTFFDKNIFRDYTRKQKCTLIPLNNNIKIRRASKNHGRYTFLISNAEGDRRWYFSVDNKYILQDWLNLLTTKNKAFDQKNKYENKRKYYWKTPRKSPRRSPRRNTTAARTANAIKKSKSPRKYCDIEIESTLTPKSRSKSFSKSPSKSYSKSPSLRTFASSSQFAWPTSDKIKDNQLPKQSHAKKLPSPLYDFPSNESILSQPYQKENDHFADVDVDVDEFNIIINDL